MDAFLDCDTDSHVYNDNHLSGSICVYPTPTGSGFNPRVGAMNVMHWFHSSDMKNWTYNGPVAWGVTSLGAHPEGDQLAITCIQEVRPPTWMEQQFPRVYGYLFDGSSFTPTDWSIDDSDTKSYIDPQWYDGKMWYISLLDIQVIRRTLPTRLSGQKEPPCIQRRGSLT